MSFLHNHQGNQGRLFASMSIHTIVCLISSWPVLVVASVLVIGPMGVSINRHADV